MEKNVVMKWVKFISFGLVLLGGLNWLFVGLFDIDVIGALFGGSDSVASRVLFTLFGLGAATLLATILTKAFKKETTTAQAK